MNFKGYVVFGSIIGLFALAGIAFLVENSNKNGKANDKYTTLTNVENQDSDESETIPTDSEPDCNSVITKALNEKCKKDNSLSDTSDSITGSQPPAEISPSQDSSPEYSKSGINETACADWNRRNQIAMDNFYRATANSNGSMQDIYYWQNELKNLDTEIRQNAYCGYRNSTSRGDMRVDGTKMQTNNEKQKMVDLIQREEELRRENDIRNGYLDPNP